MRTPYTSYPSPRHYDKKLYLYLQKCFITLMPLLSSIYLRYLPPTYVVRREGNTFTLLVCPQGGVPVSHNALQYFPKCHGAAGGGGVPCQVQLGGGTLPGSGWEGALAGGVPWLGGYPGRGGTLAGGGTLARGVPWLGGGDTLAGGVPSLDNIGSTCYTAGGMPLAFTQEDFLVFDTYTNLTQEV